jgi:transcription elongation factor Elf1
MKEQFFQCPYCWENISVLVDTSVSSQSYIEDCEVCCRPINITVHSQNDEIIAFETEAIQ